MTKGKMGNASPVRKAFVAFKTAFVTNPLVVISFEKRLDADNCNAVAMQFGVNLSYNVIGLPKGEFNLHENFYDTGMITLKTGVGDELKSYGSIGDFADSLDYGESDYLDSEYWLAEIAGLICDGFSNENIPFPSRENLERMFLVGDNYAKIQQSLNWSFAIAKEQGKLEAIILDAMSEYHGKYIGYAYEKGIIDKDIIHESVDISLNRVYSILPFEIVSHISVGAVYDAFLPVILASGIQIDQEKLFTLRVERGRAFLKEFVGGEVEDDEMFDTLTNAISERPKELQPLMTDKMAETFSNISECMSLAAALCTMTWSDAIITSSRVPVFPLSDLFDDED